MDIHTPKIQTQSFGFRFITSMDELKHSLDIAGRQFEPPISHQDRRLAELEKHFPADRSLMLIATTNEMIVGGAFGFRQDQDAIMRLLALENSARGRGVGRRLVEIFEIQSMLLGVRGISLGSVEEARKFYHRLGYRGKVSMHKGMPLPGKLLDLKLKRWSDHLGDLDSGHFVSVNEQSRQIPSLF